MQKNLVTFKNSIIPSYLPASDHWQIQLYMNWEGKLCIIGEYDNNYLDWVSFSTIDQVDENAEVFWHLFQRPTLLTSNLSRVIGRDAFYDVYGRWLSIVVRKQEYPSKPGKKYCTFSGSSYFSAENVEGSRFLAQAIQRTYEENLEKCAYRSYIPNYHTVLDSYTALFTLSVEDKVEHYRKTLPLKNLLDAESYLRISPDPVIRTAYTNCMSAASNLYNAYMGAIR